jgi:hypothetical protein
MKRILKTLAVAAFFLTTQAHADVNVATQDIDGDGRVTFKEFLESHDAGFARNEAFINRHRPVFDNADVNNDGFVDASESQGSGGKSKVGGDKKKS